MPRPKKADEPVAEGAEKVEETVASDGDGEVAASPKKRGRKPGVTGKKAPAEPTRDRIPRGAKAAANIKLAEKDETEVKPKKKPAGGSGKGRGRPKKEAAKEEVSDEPEENEGSGDDEEESPAKKSKTANGSATNGKAKAGKKAVAVEACKSWSVFKRKALEIGSVLQEAYPDLEVLVNEDGAPRRGAFELTLVVGEERHSLWSGIKKGPPRKDKFPEPAAVLDMVNKHLQ